MGWKTALNVIAFNLAERNKKVLYLHRKAYVTISIA